MVHHTDRYYRPSNAMLNSGSYERSPCPALNILANHGYIARSGKALHAIDIASIASRVFNMNLATLYAATLVILLRCRINPFSSFGLNDISRHGDIEHDASLFHDDHYTGKHHSHVNRRHIKSLVRRTNGKDVTSANLKAHLAHRVASCKSTNPDFKYGMFETHFGQVELKLLQKLNRSGSVSDLVNLIQYERLPADYLQDNAGTDTSHRYIAL
jgi:hypothetical protein